VPDQVWPASLRRGEDASDSDPLVGHIKASAMTDDGSPGPGADTDGAGWGHLSAIPEDHSGALFGDHRGRGVGIA
jgi:hypothetical protein